MKGSPAEPMSDAELDEKVRGCLAFGLGSSGDQADRLIAAIRSLDAAPDAARAVVDAFPVSGSRAR
jgi:hypothetical protein